MAEMLQQVSAVPVADLARTGPARFFPLCYLDSLLVYVAPRAAGRVWLRIPLWQAGVVALINCGLACFPLSRLAAFLRDQGTVGGREVVPFPRAVIGAVIMGVLIAEFFSLLPFAARPGSNRTCARHVLRAVLLSTSAIWLGAAAYKVLNLLMTWYVQHSHNRDFLAFPDNIVALVMFVSVLLFVVLFVHARAVGVEYRVAGDLPKPRDPLCDVCGYDLCAAAADGRCPECGRPVVESLGPDVRPPSGWEMHPSFLRLTTVGGQFARLYTSPMRMFSGLPLLSGHHAARCWLAGMLTLVGVLAFWIVEGLHAVSPDLLRGPTDWQFYAAGVSIAATFVLLGLMMVGIETAGVTLVGRFRGGNIDLGGAAKVTCYASGLLPFWVLLAGVQIVAMVICSEHGVFKRVGPRYDEAITLGSLALAHIGGLLWFELTVYRGLRAIQFANK